MDADRSSVSDLSQLNVAVGEHFSVAALAVLDSAKIDVSQVDIIGSHGITMYHHPEKIPIGSHSVRSTLQIGDPAVLAARTRCVAVGDFRLADIAAGGSGAPLAPYFDYIVLAHESEARGSLNLGGIANITSLPPDPGVGEIVAFDTGPANMVIDAVMRLLFNANMDEGGVTASSGRVDPLLLEALLRDPYFSSPPPKSTGRERFGQGFAEHMISLADGRGIAREDIVATATALTVESISRAYRVWIEPEYTWDRLIVAGGGTHNRALMAGLERSFDPIPVNRASDYGVDIDAKEAICFAVLAHEAINGVASNVPGATGASGGAVLGKISLPG